MGEEKQRKSKRKKFDKKNAVRFTVVHRDQRDPKMLDSEASTSVLVPVIENKRARRRKKGNRRHGVNEYGRYMFNETDKKGFSYFPPKSVVREEEKTLADVLESSEFKKAAEVLEKYKISDAILPSKVERNVGLLNLEDQSQFDPEEFDLDFMNQLLGDFSSSYEELEDDFVALANKAPSGEESEYSEYSDSGYYDYEEDQEGADSGRPYYEGTTLVSHISGRSQYIDFIEENFDKVFDREYERDDDSEGSEGDGPQDINQLDDVLNDYINYINNDLVRNEKKVVLNLSKEEEERLRERIVNYVSEEEESSATEDSENSEESEYGGGTVEYHQILADESSDDQGTGDPEHLPKTITVKKGRKKPKRKKGNKIEEEQEEENIEIEIGKRTRGETKEEKKRRKQLAKLAKRNKRAKKRERKEAKAKKSKQRTKRL